MVSWEAQAQTKEAYGLVRSTDLPYSPNFA